MKNIRAETIKNFAILARVGDSATTAELADAFGVNPINVITVLKRYLKAGYVTRGEVEEIRFDKNGRQVTRKMHTWSPTDKLKDYVDATEYVEKIRKPRPIANSVFQWGQT